MQNGVRLASVASPRKGESFLINETLPKIHARCEISRCIEKYLNCLHPVVGRSPSRRSSDVRWMSLVAAVHAGGQAALSDPQSEVAVQLLRHIVVAVLWRRWCARTLAGTCGEHTEHGDVDKRSMALSERAVDDETADAPAVGAGPEEMFPDQEVNWERCGLLGTSLSAFSDCFRRSVLLAWDIRLAENLFFTE